MSTDSLTISSCYNLFLDWTCGYLLYTIPVLWDHICINLSVSRNPCIHRVLYQLWLLQYFYPFFYLYLWALKDIYESNIIILFKNEWSKISHSLQCSPVLVLCISYHGWQLKSHLIMVERCTFICWYSNISLGIILFLFSLSRVLGCPPEPIIYVISSFWPHCCQVWILPPSIGLNSIFRSGSLFPYHLHRFCSSGHIW